MIRSQKRPAKFTLRMLFLLVSLACLLCAFGGFLYRTWFRPRNVGLQAQAQFDELFAKNRWNGYAAVYFYDYRVRIISSDVGDAEVSKIKALLPSIYWLRLVELQGTGVTEKGGNELKSALPNCFIRLKDETLITPDMPNRARM